MADHQIQHVRVRYPGSPDEEQRRRNREMYLGYQTEPVKWVVARVPGRDGYYAILGTGVISGMQCKGKITARVRDEWLQRGIATEGDL